MRFHNQRSTERAKCNINVTTWTVLEMCTAKVVDISENGAQLKHKRPFPQGTRINIECDGDVVRAVVAWAEIDRMGVKFDQPPATTNKLGRFIQEARRQKTFAVSMRNCANFGKRVAYG